MYIMWETQDLTFGDGFNPTHFKIGDGVLFGFTVAYHMPIAINVTCKATLAPWIIPRMVCNHNYSIYIKYIQIYSRYIK